MLLRHAGHWPLGMPLHTPVALAHTLAGRVPAPSCTPSTTMPSITLSGSPWKEKAVGAAMLPPTMLTLRMLGVALALVGGGFGRA